MSRILTSGATAITLLGFLIAACPAAAQEDDDVGPAIASGIVGFALGSALTSDRYSPDYDTYDRPRYREVRPYDRYLYRYRYGHRYQRYVYPEYRYAAPRVEYVSPYYGGTYYGGYNYYGPPYGDYDEEDDDE